MPDDTDAPDLDPDELIVVHHPELEPDNTGKPARMSRAYLEAEGSAKGWVEGPRPEELAEPATQEPATQEPATQSRSHTRSATTVTPEV
jgi:hypothetical protein